jgi:hypothetical protein
MFTYGGSFAPTRARNLTYPEPSVPLGNHEDRGSHGVLVFGGTTAGLLHTLRKAGVRALLVEAAEHVENLKAWADGHAVVPFTPDLLTTLPHHVFDAVLLPGGTLHTGGPFWEGATWADQRHDLFAALGSLIRSGGVLYADAATPRDNLVRCVALGRDDEGTCTAETSVHQGEAGTTLTVRIADYGVDGRRARLRVMTRPWVPLAPGEAEQITGTAPATVIDWIDR